MTHGRSVMSRPRAATSVATSTSISPFLNDSSAAMRSCCVLSPWMAVALMPSCSRPRASRDAPILVLEKTITCFRSRWRRMCATSACFWFSSTLYTTCVTRSAVALLRATSIVSGLFRKVLASFLISGEKVAENIRFWRCFGSRLMMRCRSGRKPMSSMRSASSMTSICTWLRLMLVMDEADRMLDMGFLPDLQRIINLLPKQRQNLMFSATFSPEIKKLANTFLNNPLTIEVARSNATAERVTQVVYKVEENQKHALVAHILRQRDLKQVIVFSNTKIGASRLARGLEQEGMNATAIHGDKTQQERMAALESFKKGEIDVLVATDVAARGLDITDLPCVINYDLPYNAEDYVHRIGRTGRAGASGDAISIYSDKDERLLADIEKLIKQTITRGDLAGFTPSSSRGDERGERRPPRRAEGVASAPSEGRAPRASSAAGEPRENRDSSRSASSEVRDSRGAAPRMSERGPRASSGPLPRREKTDPWFLKPYEPAKAPAPAASGNALGASASAKPKQKLAALLGGLPK